MSRLLLKASLGYHKKHRWQAFLSLLGIAIGVAVVISIDLANQSAKTAFQQSMSEVMGKATHTLINPVSGIPDSIYTNFRLKHGITKSAPVVEGTVVLKGKATQTFTLLGIDPFAERLFRPSTQHIWYTKPYQFSDFITLPSAIVLSAPSAKALGVEVGDSLQLKFGSIQTPVTLIGLIQPKETDEVQSFQNLCLTDISTAQTLLQKTGFLSRIDFIFKQTPEDQQLLKALLTQLPPGFQLKPAGAREAMAEQMTLAFELNLSALSWLALIVGMFLIYNMMTFSVVQRHRFFGLLRATGVVKSEILTLILAEAVILGILGSVLGIGMGIALADSMVALISRSINDLYYTTKVQEVIMSWVSLTKAVGLGIGVTLLSALQPAREAMSHSASLMLRRSASEIRFKSLLPHLSGFGVASLLIGSLVLMSSKNHILLSYIGILLIIIGASLLTPLALVGFIKTLNPLVGAIWGASGRLALGHILSEFSRSSVAIAALALAVGATFAVGTMIGSFRHTVVSWLEERLKADIYISAPSLVSRRNDALLPNDILARYKNVEGIQDFSYYREIKIPVDSQEISIIGIHLTGQNKPTYKFKSGDPKTIWKKLSSGNHIIITEPFAFKHRLEVGDSFSLPTRQGHTQFVVQGIYYDYGSDLGFITMPYEQFQKFWPTKRFSAISVNAKPGVDINRLAETLRRLSPPDEELMVRTNTYLRKSSIEIFDRSFAIAGVLQLLTIIVALIGIFSALMAFQLEKSRELGVLRATGLTISELWRLTLLQTSIMGIISGVLALPLGNALAWILIHVISARSFGWTFQFQFFPDLYLQAILLAVLAALISGLIPAYKMAKTSPAEALRSE